MNSADAKFVNQLATYNTIAAELIQMLTHPEETLAIIEAVKRGIENAAKQNLRQPS